MNFIREINHLDFILLGFFLVLYLLYAIRLYRISKVLSSNISKITLKIILRGLYLSLIFYALMGPYIDKGKGDSTIKAVSKDIFVALDLSLSMNATDIAPSRIERAKFAINKITKAFSTDKIGLIVFSSDAFLQCPLTYDKNALGLFLQTANSNLVPHSGTDLEKPLNLALSKHSKQSKTENAAKVIILVSDGEDFGENMEDIAEEIKDEGIKVFTVGIGTKKGSKIIHHGRVKYDKEGKEVLTTLNSKSLKKLARITKGKYYEINESRSDVKKLINDINDIKGQVSDVQVDTAIAKNSKYQYFIMLAMLLMIIDLLFSIKIFKI